MENKQYLESQYNINFSSAANYVKQGNHKDALAAFARALDAVVNIIKITVGQEQKEYRQRADKIVVLIEKVKAEIKKPQEIDTGDTEKKFVAGDNEKDTSSGITYKFLGVNVEQFLVKESNDVVTFDDVKGMTEEKKLIKREFFLDDEDRAFRASLGKKSKNFILLYGVPGTGKTFFAKAISEELKRYSGGDIPFFSVVGSQLSDAKVGASERNIQALFEFCKQFEHCVLFIDEFDTLAPDRKIPTGDPTAAQRVTTLLQMMDGFSSSKGTLVIAATNCPYNLDGAVLSRANTRIEIPLPNYEVVYSVLKSKIGKKIAEDVDLSAFASRLARDGYSNRDIKNFIESMSDQLYDEFQNEKARGEKKSFEEYRYTNVMIEKAFKEIVPTTKQSDKDRIEQFKKQGE